MSQFQISNFKYQISNIRTIFIRNWKLEIVPLVVSSRDPEGDGRNWKFPQGFTLIELLVVIGIMAVLATATITLLNPAAQVQRARDARRKSDLAQVQRAIELYYHDNSQYPPASTIVWGGSWPPYMNAIPRDPVPGRNYAYITTGQAYYLYASLERGANDPQACNGGNQCSNAGSANCGGVCNFGLSSPNVIP